MRPIGFSTGALAYADFMQGLSIIRANGLRTIELSALRENELEPLLESLIHLDLSDFEYVSFHAPSKIVALSEQKLIELLKALIQKKWPLIVHPDVITEFDDWAIFGDLLCIENMDKRKPIGRTARELALLFEELPNASLCLDMGHVRQVDPTMSVAFEILERFGGRLRQLHVSEVNTNSQHDALTFETALAFQKVSALIPQSVPIILESRITPDRVNEEVSICRDALAVLIAA
jgi:hypothetical protein